MERYMATDYRSIPRNANALVDPSDMLFSKVLSTGPSPPRFFPQELEIDG